MEKYKNGFVAWAAGIFIVLTSIPYMRRRFFDAFLYSHFAFAVFFLFGYYHTLYFKNYFIAAVVIYGIDKLLRAVWGLLPKSTTSIDVSHKGVVKLSFPKNTIPKSLGIYQPGQYVSWIFVFVYVLRRYFFFSDESRIR